MCVVATTMKKGKQKMRMMKSTKHSPQIKKKKEKGISIKDRGYNKRSKKKQGDMRDEGGAEFRRCIEWAKKNNNRFLRKTSKLTLTG